MKAYQAISQANCKMITKCLLCQWSMLWVQFISFNSLLVGFLFAKMHHTGGGVYMMGWGLLVHTRCDVWVMRAGEDCGRRGLKPVANLTPDNPRWPRHVLPSTSFILIFVPSPSTSPDTVIISFSCDTRNPLLLKLQQGGQQLTWVRQTTADASLHQR